MNVDKLQFFGSNGFNLNFSWNKKYGYWEGNIYLPKVSVGLYANTSIYILEEIGSEFFFPTGNGKIKFNWDRSNKFVDEFFMFNFDEDYILTETSALIYTPNDGPECNTLIINRFDNYECDLSNGFSDESKKALPVHVAFMASEKYDATTYNRTLIMSYNNEVIAKIKFYAETVEEDERLKIWNDNLGYNITPEDTMIFYKSDIKEYRPDYMLLNEKRKELMMEGSNIYPYIGSYKAIINAIKFFGYENLNIIEYWRCVNPDDKNFGKVFHSSKYSLTKKETLRIGARNIILPNKDYRKINALALVYSINKPTGQIDEWELPIVKEKFTYTIEEALIKLFALRKKLNKEFMPGSSKIIDIIGEANYFGIHGIAKIHDESCSEISEHQDQLSFDVYPKKYIHITDNEYYDRYINIKKNNDSTESIAFHNQMLSDIFSNSLNDIRDERLKKDHISLTNPENCEYYTDYYRDVFVDQVVYKAILNNDDYPYDSQEYDYTGNPYTRFTAKTVLRNTSFQPVTFNDCDLKFSCMPSNASKDNNGRIIDSPTQLNPTFENIDTIIKPQKIKWEINMSKPDIDIDGVKYQVDEELKNVGILKTYEYHDLNLLPTITQLAEKFKSRVGSIDEYNQFFAELPYLGYYDVTMTLGDDDGRGGMTNTSKKTVTKCIKVEPYQIEIIGFYYDARDLPEKLKYENDENSVMYKFIQENINHMHGWATAERTDYGENALPIDQTMPYYEAEGDMIGTGPYFNENVEDEWYLADNLTYEIGLLEPIIKYTRYIRSGVDVKPYTWFLLGYEYSKIAGKVNPCWTITNETTGETERSFYGKYLTLLVKKEGNYKVTLTLEDKNGNKYEITRNIIVVKKDANYKLYQTFKKEYDNMTEQDMLRELNEFYAQDKENGDDDTPVEYEEVDVDVTGETFFENDYINVHVTGYVDYDKDIIDVDVNGTVSFETDHYDVDVEGIVIGTTPVSVDVTIIPNSPIPVTIDGTISETEVVPVSVDASVSGSETVPVSIDGSIIETDTVPVDVEMTVSESEIVPVGVEASLMESETVPVNLDITVSENENVPVNIDATVMPTDIIPVNVDVTVSGQDVVSTNIDATVIESDVVSTNIDATVIQSDVVPVNIDASLSGQDIVPVNIDVTIDEEENE